MQLTKKQLEFWTFLLLCILGASVLILLVDFGIKAAILEESTRLRLKIEDWERGQINTRSNTSGTSNDSANDSTIPTPVLVDKPTRMETTNVPNGVAKSSATPRNRRRAQPKGQANDSGISNGNEQVG